MILVGSIADDDTVREYRRLLRAMELAFDHAQLESGIGHALIKTFNSELVQRLENCSLCPDEAPRSAN